jgi:hypothetical protein
MGSKKPSKCGVWSDMSPFGVEYARAMRMPNDRAQAQADRSRAALKAINRELARNVDPRRIADLLPIPPPDEAPGAAVVPMWFQFDRIEPHRTKEISRK